MLRFWKIGEMSSRSCSNPTGNWTNLSLLYLNWKVILSLQWQTARELAQKCRKSGKTIPATDLLIASCALVHHVPVEHQDAHLDTALQIHAGN